MMKAKVAVKPALLPIEGCLTRLVLTDLGKLSPARFQLHVNKTFQMTAAKPVFHMMNGQRKRKINIWH